MPSRRPRSVAAVLVAATLSGCFGYNSGAKGWSYFADSVLVAGGAAAIAADRLNKPEACSGSDCTYTAPVSGGFVVGTMLVTAGIIGILFNATRSETKISH